jgi:UDP-glucose:glycoprotein glucosyltransferase
VELALKRTDYIVIDDRSAGAEGTENQALLISNEPDTEAESPEILLDTEEVSDLKPLSAKELLGLGPKVGSFIMASDDPFETLLKVSQDFPKHSSTITKRNATVDFLTEHNSNREVFLPAGYNVIWINGQQVQSRQMDAFALLEQLRRERAIVGNLRSLGLSGSEAVNVLSNPAIAEAKMDGDTQRYDYRDTIEGGKVVIWLNDIEKDKRYNGWPSHSSAVSPDKSGASSD